MKIGIFGKPSHASVPEYGINAILLTSSIFAKIGYTANDLINFMNENCQNDVYLSHIIGNDSDETGRFTFSIGTVLVNDNKSQITFNTRFLASMNFDDTKKILTNIYDKYNLSYQITWEAPPVNHKETQFVKELQQLCVDYSIYGQKDYSYVGGLMYSNLFKDCYTICVIDNFYVVDINKVIPGQHIPHAYNERMHVEGSWENMISLYADALQKFIK